MQNSVRENCSAQCPAAEEQRRQQHAAARTLGPAGAWSSEPIGTAVGAFGVASAVASQFRVQGAVAGARSAWSGSRLQEAPRIEVQLPGPATLPPPLPANPPPSGAPCAPEGAEAATREADRRAADSVIDSWKAASGS